LTGRGFRLNKVSLGKWRFAALGALLLYLLLAVVLPYLSLIYGAFTPFLTPKVDLSTLSTSNFEKFFSRNDLVQGLKNTAILVTIGAFATAVIATSVGYLIRRLKGPVARGLEVISLLPLAIPTLSFALGILWATLSFGPAREHLYGTLAIIFLAQMANFLPLGVQIVAAGVVQLGDEMEDAGRVSGAGGFTRWRRIAFPLLRPAIASAWIVLALEASVEAGLSVFLFTGQSVTTAVNVFNNALFGLPNVMYAGALILATFGLVAIVLGNWAFGTGKYLQNSRAGK
jgi:iron(III) transport system permease protein